MKEKARKADTLKIYTGITAFHLEWLIIITTQYYIIGYPLSNNMLHK